MIIKQVEDKERTGVCPNCGSEVPARHQALGYCPKCYYDIVRTDEDGERKIRFYVL